MLAENHQADLRLALSPKTQLLQHLADSEHTKNHIVAALPQDSVAGYMWK